jgi:hypothetical protein
VVTATDAQLALIFARCRALGIDPAIVADIRRRVRRRTLTKTDAGRIIDALK